MSRTCARSRLRLPLPDHVEMKEFRMYGMGKGNVKLMPPRVLTLFLPVI